MKKKPRMTVAFVAEQLVIAYPDCYAEFSEFMRKKRMIGIVNDAMSAGELDWIMHRGQRRITPDYLDAWLERAGARFEAIAQRSREALARPEYAKPIEERYPLPQRTGPRPPRGKRRERERNPAGPDMGQNLGEIDE